MTTKRLSTFLAVILSMLAVPAFADTLSQTRFFTGIPSMNGSLTFNQFYDNGGAWTLQSIEVSLTLQASGGYIRIDNDSSVPASFSFTFGAGGVLSSTDVNLSDSLNQPVPGQVAVYRSQSFNLAGNVGDGTGDYDPTPPDGALYNGNIVTDTNVGFIGNYYWDKGTEGFLGTGTYDVNYSVWQHFTYDVFGGIEFKSIPANASGLVTVLYTYDTIPEPATIALLCTGLIFLLKRKRKKQ
jgi:hypothetical protein